MAVAYVLPILKMEEEDPNRDPTRVHFQRPFPHGSGLCAPYFKDGRRGPQQGSHTSPLPEAFPPWQWLIYVLPI